MANYKWSKIAIGSDTYECREWVGYCPVSASQQEKTVTINGFTFEQLSFGCKVTVWFNYAQGYNGNPTLNVSSTGAKPIQTVVGNNAGAFAWRAGEIITFVYDGDYWIMEDGANATTTYYGNTLLTNTISNDDTKALTPKAVYDAGYLTLADLPVWDGSVT